MFTTTNRLNNFHLFWSNVRQRATGRLAIISTLWARHRSRRQLAGLSDRMLKDIGLSRGEAEREAAKPFWRE